MKPPRSLVSRLTFAVVLALGVAATWMTLAVWIASLLVGRGTVHEDLVFTPRGEPVIRRMRVGEPNFVYRGLDGQRVEIDVDASWLTAAQVAGVPESRGPSMPKDWTSRLLPLTDGGSPATYWYLVHDGRRDGRAYFVGYGSHSKRVVGYLGPGGFRDAPPVSPQDFFDVPLVGVQGLRSMLASGQALFSSSHEPWYFSTQSRMIPAWHVFLIDGGKVVRLDLRHRDASPETIVQAEGLLSVALLASTYWKGPQAQAAGALVEETRSDDQNDLLIAATADAILLHDPVAETSSSLERPTELNSQPLQVYRAENGDFLLEHARLSPDNGRTSVVYTLSPKGEVRNRIEVQLNPVTPENPSALAAVGAPLALASTLFAAVLQPLAHMSTDDSLLYREAVVQSLRQNWPFLLATYLIGGVLAWRCHLRQRRYGDPSIVPWMLLVVVLGVPGYVAYRLHRRWPVRLLCPSCNRPSPRDGASCHDCGAAFPPPEVKGVEVFA